MYMYIYIYIYICINIINEINEKFFKAVFY